MSCETLAFHDEESRRHGTTIPSGSIATLQSDQPNWSLHFWLYSTPNGKGLVGGQGLSSFPRFFVNITNDRRMCFGYQSNENLKPKTCCSRGKIPTNQWLSVVCSVSRIKTGTNLFLLIDGVVEDHCIMNEFLRLSKLPFHVGGYSNKKNPERSQKGFKGLISGLRIDGCTTMKTPFSRKPSFPVHYREPLVYESQPIRSLQEFAMWQPGNDPMNVSYVPLRQRNEDSDKIRVIHCHDMAGGYGQDWNVQGQFTNSPVERPDSNPFKMNSYNFFNWELVDTFIYFSHARVAMPPPGWTDAAHKNGVKVLATFITEFGGGAPDNFVLLDGPNGENEGKVEPSYFFADKFIEMARYYGFDGWFFNIESDLAGAVYVNKMLLFLRYLKEKMQSELPGSLVCWYDSVIATTGQVRWQNILNDLNKPFFDESDSIFCNYSWRQDYPQLSADASEGRPTDVYMGIDIWGRGTFGGGGFNTYVALDVIVRAGTSAALFAPGWTYEPTASGPDRTGFEENEARLWLGQMKSKDRNVQSSKDEDESKWVIIDREEEPEIVDLKNTSSGVANTNNNNTASVINTGVNSYVERAQHSLSVLPFVSHINQAIGEHMFVEGESVMRDNQWFYMAQQDPQPSYEIRSSTLSSFTSSIAYETAFDGGSSVRVSVTPTEEFQETRGKEEEAEEEADHEEEEEEELIKLDIAEFPLFGFSGSLQSDVLIDYAVFSRDSEDCDLAVILETIGGRIQLGGKQRSPTTDQHILPNNTQILNGWEKRQFSLPRTTISKAFLLATTERPLNTLCSMYFGRLMIADQNSELHPKAVTNLSNELSFNMNTISSENQIYTLNLRWETEDENVSHFDIYRDSDWIGRAFSPNFVVYEEEIDDNYDHTFGVRPASLTGFPQRFEEITRIRIRGNVE